MKKVSIKNVQVFLSTPSYHRHQKIQQKIDYLFIYFYRNLKNSIEIGHLHMKYSNELETCCPNKTNKTDLYNGNGNIFFLFHPQDRQAELSHLSQW